MTALYSGFSTSNYLTTKQGFTLVNLAVVKQDLLNQIFTRKGSRLKMPNFGTLIPDLIFEPMDDSTLSTIQSELNTVFTYDPRVELLSMNIIPLEELNTVVASAVLQYIELNMTDRFDLSIEFSSPNG